MLSFLTALAVFAQTDDQTLKIDPLQLVEAAEIWSIIGNAKNPVWPGWDASKTPVLVYFPNKQEVLVNHPNPPAGFHKYTGPFVSPIGTIFVRNGKTTFVLDGQNTSTDINGIETLVVADTQSTKRQWIESIADAIVSDRTKADEVVAQGIFSNPISSMTIFAHEAFHVYQRHMAPKKGGNETALTKYPTLSVENNVWLALESDFLAAALRAKSPAEARQEGIKWLASRQHRRAAINKVSADYEDGTEFNEGLAKYVEYRTLQCFEGKKPGRDMWLIQGFPGYGNVAKERDSLIESMRGFMSGKFAVNNDLYGASPVRFRLYYSGMAIGALLDRLGAKWHDRALKTDATLTALATEALNATPSDLTEATKAIEASARYRELVTQKQKLADDGAAYVQKEVAKFSEAPGELVIDYSHIASPKVGFSFTPFGILAVDDDRTIYRLIPIRGSVGSLSFSENSSRPVLHDTKAKTVHLQLTEAPVSKDGDIDLKELALPGVNLKDVKGKLTIDGKRVTLVLAE